MTANQTFTKLPDSELEIMEAIWALYEEEGKPVTASMTMKRFPDLERRRMTTVLTLINRLVARGFLAVDKTGRSNSYTPLVDVHEYRRTLTEDFLYRAYMDEPMELLLNVIQSAHLSQDDITTLTEALAEK